MDPVKNSNVPDAFVPARTVTPMNGRLARSLVMTLGVAVSASCLSAAPAVAATLTDARWWVSNNANDATGVRYMYWFTTVTTGVIDTITMTVPAGTAGTPTIVESSGIGAGRVGLVANTLSYTVSTPVLVPAGTPIFIDVGGIDNTSAISSSTSTVTTLGVGPVTIDSGTTNANMITGAPSPPVATSPNPSEASSPPLARTGAASSASLGTLGSAMVTVGAMFAITGRRRQRRRRFC